MELLTINAYRHDNASVTVTLAEGGILAITYGAANYDTTERVFNVFDFEAVDIIDALMNDSQTWNNTAEAMKQWAVMDTVPTAAREHYDELTKEAQAISSVLHEAATALFYAWSVAISKHPFACEFADVLIEWNDYLL